MLVLNQTHWAKPPNTWLLRKNGSLKTYFLRHSLILSARMILHDRSLNDKINLMRWININNVFQLLLTTAIYHRKQNNLVPDAVAMVLEAELLRRKTNLVHCSTKVSLSNIIAQSLQLFFKDFRQLSLMISQWLLELNELNCNTLFNVDNSWKYKISYIAYITMNMSN